MSSHATEGARPSAAPAGESATAEGASVAPVEAAPAGASPAGAAASEAYPTGAEPTGAVLDPDDSEGPDDPQGPDDPDDSEGPEDPQGPDDPENSEDLEPEPDYAAPDDEPVSKLAIAAFVTGLFALVPLAVGFGVAALVGIRRTGRRGHGMATAGLFLSAGWLIIAAAFGIVGMLTHGFHKPVTIKYHEAAVFKLRVGDCVNSPNQQVVTVLPCSAPHDAEVFATFSLPASAWPGTSAISKDASSGCVSRLSGYLNPQLATSLSQAYVYPNQTAWTAGTRTVICEVRAGGGQLTGSVRAAH